MSAPAARGSPWLARILRGITVAGPGVCLCLCLCTGTALAARPTAKTTAATAPDIIALVRAWAGVHDTEVQVILDDHSPRAAAQDVSRLRTVIAPVDLPWLGTAVLYLEETVHDAPGAPRRQVLLRLSMDTQLRPRRIRVRQYTIRNPRQWRGLFANPQAQLALRRADLRTLPGCDLLLTREGEQFQGGTLGRGCVAAQTQPLRYVDYRLRVGPGLYWSRIRQYRFEDDALVQESAGYDWPALHLARLYNCRIRWSSSGQPADLVPLLNVAVVDHGGHADFSLPDGRTLRLILHSDDWPFDASNMALILTLQDLAPGGITVRSWTAAQSRQVTASMKAMDARCGAIAPPASPTLAAVWR